MRCLIRNKQVFWYANYLRREPIEDDYGNATGEYEIVRTNPIRDRGNVSAAKSSDFFAEPFGDDIDYNRILQLEQSDYPMTENSVLWVGITPALNRDGSLKLDSNGHPETPWNYVVRSVARSVNGVRFALKEVVVS